MSQTFNVPLKIAFTSTFGNVKEFGMCDSLEIGFNFSSSSCSAVAHVALPNGYSTVNHLVSKKHDPSSDDASWPCSFDRIAPEPRLYRKFKQPYNDASRIQRICATDRYIESNNMLNI
jgi:hypothetical protein